MATSERKSRARYLFVAAIDFGTTYSGYAFSFRHDFEAEKMNIYTNVTWKPSGVGSASWKTPTTLLLNPDYTFNSFGYMAEDEYNELIELDEHHDYHYFRRFKMLLHDRPTVNRDITIKDSASNEFSAKTVFSHSIKYLKGHLLEKISERKLSIDKDDIQWVLTVPAIWNEAGKQFMREAAEDAGIPKKHLILALEPEAASLFCKYYPVERCEEEKTNLVPFKVGTKYMVLDLGGGTVDVTVHEVIGPDSLKELHIASGGAWGGVRIDEEYIDLLKSILGDQVIRTFQDQRRTELLEFLRDFEMKKRTITDDTKGKPRPIVICIPATLSDVLRDETGEELRNRVAASDFGDKIAVKPGNKLAISRDIMEKLFERTKQKILDHIKHVLNEPSGKGVSAILMVGGFSTAKIIAEAVEKEFTKLTVIVPPDPELAVVKGAVLYGHEPLTIASRVCKFTYGIATEAVFNPDRHPEEKKVVKNGEVLCKDLFSKFVEIGQSVNVDQVFRNEYGVTSQHSPLTIQIYTSCERDPITTTDCYKLGDITIKPPQGGWKKGASILVQMKFGGTEFEVFASDVIDTETVYTATFDFLR